MELDKSKISPVSNRMLVEVRKADTKMESGIELADVQTNAAPVMGIIVKAGPDSSFKDGTTVMFRRYAIDELKIQTDEGETSVYFLEDGDILATIEVEEAPKPPAKSGDYSQIIQKQNADGTSEKGEEGEEAEVAEEEQVGGDKK